MGYHQWKSFRVLPIYYLLIKPGNDIILWEVNIWHWEEKEGTQRDIIVGKKRKKNMQISYLTSSGKAEIQDLPHLLMLKEKKYEARQWSGLK